MKKTSLLEKLFDRSEFSLSNPAPWKKLERIKGAKFVEYRKLLAQAEAGTLLTDFPVEVLVKTTLNCNHKCPKCLHGIGVFPSGPQYDMSFDTLKKVLDEGSAKGLKSVVLTGGEPFSHPKIIDFISYAGGFDFPDLNVVSNGALMTDEIIDCLITHRVARINISVDATTKETFQVVRGVDDFENVTARIQALLKRRAERNSELPLLAVSFVLSKENAHEVDEFVAYWKTRADGGIKVYPYKNVFSIVDDEFSATYGKGKKGRADLKSETLPEALAKDIPVVSQYNNARCMTPWFRCHVGINGELQGCTTQGFCDHPQMVMGNIHSCSFEQAWKSGRWSELRELTKTKQFDKHPVCYKCQRAV